MAIFFYINLDRVPKRSEFMEKQLKSVGFQDSAERFSAVDAAQPGVLENTGYRPGGWRPRWNMTKTEIACFESHRRLWQKIVDDGLDSAFVMEDDVFLSTRCADAIKAIEYAPKDLDVLKIDGSNMNGRYGAFIKLGDYQLRPILQTVQSSAAYRITFKGASRLLDISHRYSDTVDDFIFQPRENWRASQLFPAVAVQGMFREDTTVGNQSTVVATSERTADPDLNTNVDKGPTAYRVTKELKRFVRKTKRKLWEDQILLRKGGFIGPPPLAEDLGRYRNLGS
ncbi:MAG: glycosyltransferase family 25 protein [Planctomycetes bacterium]|nr:glycosyltransferase family 25 protein [Planctomycetota bacterium]